MHNHKKNSKKPFSFAALLFLALALIFITSICSCVGPKKIVNTKTETASTGFTDSKDSKTYKTVTASASFTDSRDGKTYKTIKIGEQTWMAENLNYETKCDCSVCYDDNPAICAKYGHLYDWEMAIKVCPKGWHLPSNAEWDKLLRFVDGDKGKESPYESKTAGKYLKAKSGWNEDGNGIDAHGFSARPGGCGLFSSFSRIGYFGLWWSASESNSDFAYGRYMVYDIESVYYNNSAKEGQFSVRCVKD